MHTFRNWDKTLLIFKLFSSIFKHLPIFFEHLFVNSNIIDFFNMENIHYIQDGYINFFL